MSPFLAVFELGATPSTREWVVSLEQKLRALPHDRFQCLERADFWIAQASLNTGAVDDERPTPRCANDGRFVVVFSGWIENRDEFDAALTHAKPSEQAFDDADRVLAGWLQWGEALANKLYGEYAIVIYDTFNKSVFSIRDKIGVQPLFYWAFNDKVIISNLPGLIALAPFVGTEVNEGYLAEFLHANLCSAGETLFKHVTRIPGGHWLRFSTASGAQLSRYWRPSAEVINRPFDEVCAELERTLFNAVRSAASTTQTLTVEISGGIDSSSVAVVLNELAQRGELQADRMVGASKVFPGLACDETAYSACVADEVSFECARLPSTLPELDQLAHWTAQLNYPVYPFALFTSMNHYETAREQGRCVVVTGEGGDELFRPSERLRRETHFSPRHLNLAFGIVARRWRERPRGATLLGQVRHTIRPWLGTSLDDWISRLRNGRSAELWRPIEANWATRVGLAQRIAARNSPGNARVSTVEGALSGGYGHLHESLGAFGCLFGVESRHPLYSARLVEFANRLPVEFYDDFAACTKWPLRELMRGLLPENVRIRTDKAEFTPALLPTLKRIAAQQFSQSQARAMHTGAAPNTISVDLGSKYIWTLSAALAFATWVQQNPSRGVAYEFAGSK
jgi:asparagine synthase (glutamine-hydrolysing)